MSLCKKIEPAKKSLNFARGASFAIPSYAVVFLLKSFVLIGVSGCTPPSLNELRYQSEIEIKQLVFELRKLESYEDVQNSSKKLRKQFNQIADLLIETRKFSFSGREFLNDPITDELFAEMARVYEIPGARHVIETAQSEAVRRLRGVNYSPKAPAGA